MSDEIVCCYKCGFKCCKSQIMKNAGKCPKCQLILDATTNNAAKTAGVPNA